MNIFFTKLLELWRTFSIICSDIFYEVLIPTICFLFVQLVWFWDLGYDKFISHKGTLHSEEMTQHMSSKIGENIRKYNEPTFKPTLTRNYRNTSHRFIETTLEEAKKYIAQIKKLNWVRFSALREKCRLNHF